MLILFLLIYTGKVRGKGGRGESSPDDKISNIAGEQSFAFPSGLSQSFSPHRTTFQLLLFHPHLAMGPSCASASLLLGTLTSPPAAALRRRKEHLTGLYGLKSRHFPSITTLPGETWHSFPWNVSSPSPVACASLHILLLCVVSWPRKREK